MSVETIRIRVQRYNPNAKHYFDVDSIVFKTRAPVPELLMKIREIVDQLQVQEKGDEA